MKPSFELPPRAPIPARVLLCALALTALLAGCGQKGPLFMPTRPVPLATKPAASAPRPPAEPAAPPPPASPAHQ